MMNLRTLALAATLAGLLASPAAAQGGFKAPRNAFGQPDLAGVWTNATITPIERAPTFGDRLVLTDAEAATLEGATAGFNDRMARPTASGTKVDDLPECAPGVAGPTCGYNNFWLDPGTKVLRVDGQPRASIVTQPADGRIAYTPEARARIAARAGNARVGNFDGPERRPLGERCLMSFGSSAGPPMLPVLYNNHYQIVQTADEVMILVEMVHDVRLVRLGGKHKPPHVKLWMGDSIGWWEGETLVVETTNFRGDQAFRGATEALKVTERFSRVGPRRMHYAFEAHDPATFVQPVKGEVMFNATDSVIYEYACHEGNYALPGILAGAREEERQGREQAGNRGEVKDEGAE